MKIIKTLALSILLALSIGSVAQAKDLPTLTKYAKSSYDSNFKTNVKMIGNYSINAETIEYYKDQRLVLGLMNRADKKYLIDHIVLIITNESTDPVIDLEPCPLGCKLDVSFDYGKVKSYSFFSNKGDKGYMLDPKDTQEFVKELRRSDYFQVEVDTVTEYSIVYDFDIKDIDYNKIKF